METVLNDLKNADCALATVAVRGDDVYALIRARADLKRAYDKLKDGKGEPNGAA